MLVRLPASIRFILLDFFKCSWTYNFLIRWRYLATYEPTKFICRPDAL